MTKPMRRLIEAAFPTWRVSWALRLLIAKNNMGWQFEISSDGIAEFTGTYRSPYSTVDLVGTDDIDYVIEQLRGLIKDDEKTEEARPPTPVPTRPLRPVTSARAGKVYESLKAKPDVLHDVLVLALSDHYARVLNVWGRSRDGLSHLRTHCALHVTIAEVKSGNAGWSWIAPSAGIDAGDTTYSTFQEARAACDAALEDAGWVVL